MITLTIDKKCVTVNDGATILDAARQAEIDIPTMCWHKGIDPCVSCFVCVVKVDGRENFVPSCATAAVDGMVVDTSSEEVIECRKRAIELLLSDHIGRCSECEEKKATCKLRAYMLQYKARRTRYGAVDKKLRERRVYESGLVHDPGKCILCGICVGITRVRNVKPGLSFCGRGSDVHVSAPFGVDIDKAMDTALDECVAACPTGALRGYPPSSKLKYIICSLLLVISLSCGGSNDQDIKTRSDVTPWTHYRSGGELRGIAPGKVPDSLKILWTFKAGGACISSPVTDGKVVYIGSYDSTLYALDIYTGSPIWTFKAGDEIEASPVIYNDMVLVGDLDGNFFSVNKKDGTERWRFKVKDKIAGSANVIEKAERVVFGSYDNNLYCLNVNTGELIWQYGSGSYINGTPATDGERVVFGGCDAGVHVVSAEDGSLIGKIDTESYIAGSPVMKDNFAYIGSYGQKLLGIDIDEMKIAWTYVNDGRKAPFIGSPALVDTFLLAPSKDNYLHCVSSVTGKLIWKFLAKKEVDSSPVVSGDRAVFGCNAGWLYVVDLKTGALVNSYNMGGALGGAPLVSGGMVIVGDENGIVTALRGDR